MPWPPGLPPSPHTPPWSRSCRMFSSGWCAAGGRPPWWRGAAVPSGRETRFLRSGIEGHPEAGCSPLQRRCGSHLQTGRAPLVNAVKPVGDGGRVSESSKSPTNRTTSFWNSKGYFFSLRSALHRLIRYNTYKITYLRASWQRAQLVRNKGITSIFSSQTMTTDWLLWSSYFSVAVQYNQVTALSRYCKIRVFSHTKYVPEWVSGQTHLWLGLHVKAAGESKKNKQKNKKQRVKDFSETFGTSTACYCGIFDHSMIKMSEQWSHYTRAHEVRTHNTHTHTQNEESEI